MNNRMKTAMLLGGFDYIITSLNDAKAFLDMEDFDKAHQITRGLCAELNWLDDELLKQYEEGITK